MVEDDFELAIESFPVPDIGYVTEAVELTRINVLIIKIFDDTKGQYHLYPRKRTPGLLLEGRLDTELAVLDFSQAIRNHFPDIRVDVMHNTVDSLAIRTTRPESAQTRNRSDLFIKLYTEVLHMQTISDREKYIDPSSQESQ